MDIKGRLMDTLLNLTGVPGISGTSSENLTSKKLYDILADIPYFKEKPENLNLIKIQGDPLERSFVSALYIGDRNSRDTVIISGHFDVVGIEEYGHLKSIAFNPPELTKRISELSLDDDSIKDLESGEWLFGRGVADMKFGIALGVELLREYSSQMNLKGNILFLAVPAEETNSEGMIGSISHIIELQKKYDLNYRGFLLPEPYINKFPEDKKRYIHVGSCGKIMPLFLFAGKETHVSSPFSGFNPNLLASEFGRLLENNSDLCSIDKNISTPPPTCLKQTDLKELYSVQTPIYAASYFNLITLNLNPDELMDKLISLSHKAFDNAIEVFYRNKSVYEALPGSKKLDTHIKPKVITYAELHRRVKDIHGENFEYNMAQLIDRWKSGGMGIQTISINIMKETCERYPKKEPMIVIGFAPPYYPDRYPDISTQNGKTFMEVLDSIIEYARDKHSDIMVKDDYYMGICDLSYTGFNEKLDINKISDNLVGLNQTYMFPADKLKMLDIPGIVLGVYGKDLHKYTERLHLPYSLDILPDIYDFAIKELLT